MENWKHISDFRGYAVSDLGRVRRVDTGRVMAVLRNSEGSCHVGLNRGGRQYKRSLPQLVGRAFVHQPNGREAFDQLIHRDNDRTNNRADNLLWRPHWFAVKYRIQSGRGQTGSDIPVVEVRHQEIYQNTWEAALAFGLIEIDLILSITNRTFVWPTFQEFRYLAK